MFVQDQVHGHHLDVGTMEEENTNRKETNSLGEDPHQWRYMLACLQGTSGQVHTSIYVSLYAEEARKRFTYPT